MLFAGWREKLTVPFLVHSVYTFGKEVDRLKLVFSVTLCIVGFCVQDYVGFLTSCQAHVHSSHFFHNSEI